MQVWCDWQLTLCDPHLSALEVRFHDDALYKSMFTLPYLTVQDFKHNDLFLIMVSIDYSDLQFSNGWTMAHMYKFTCACFRLTSMIVIILHLPLTYLPVLLCNHKHYVVEIPLIQLLSQNKSKTTDRRTCSHGPWTILTLLDSNNRGAVQCFYIPCILTYQAYLHSIVQLINSHAQKHITHAYLNTG